MPFSLTAISAAFCLALSTGGIAKTGTMSKPDYKASKDQISAKFKDDKAACKSMTGNAKDICMEEAKGREKVAKAELEARYDPSPKHDKDVRMAKAKADTGLSDWAIRRSRSASTARPSASS